MTKISEIKNLQGKQWIIHYLEYGERKDSFLEIYCLRKDHIAIGQIDNGRKFYSHYKHIEARFKPLVKQFFESPLERNVYSPFLKNNAFLPRNQMRFKYLDNSFYLDYNALAVPGPRFQSVQNEITWLIHNWKNI